MSTHTEPRIRHAKVVLPILAIGLALTGATAYAADATTTGNGILSRFGIELSDEQKDAMDQIRELRAAGKDEEAHALAQTVGLPGRGQRHGHGMHNDMKVSHEAMVAALESNDYAAFKAATADAPFSDNVDETFFAKMVQAHTLRQSGDSAGADAIMTELGFPKPGEGRGHGMMHPGGMFLRGANLTDAQKSRLEEARSLFQSGKTDEAKVIMDAIRAEVHAASTTAN